MASQSKPRQDLPEGHVPLPVMLTGGMGLTLAAGLQGFGLLENLDRSLAGMFVEPGAVLAQPPVTPGVLWLATAVLAFGIAWVILQIPGTWRRAVIWISTLVVIAGWVPVAAIAHASAPVAAPLVACGWAGLCAIIYASRHHMAMDEPCAIEPDETSNELSQHGPD